MATSGVAAAALIGCGDEGDDGDAGGAGSSAGVSTPTSTGEGITTASGRFIPYRFDYDEVTPKSGGTLRFRDWHDPGPLDPSVSAGGGTLIAANAIYERLIGGPGGPEVDPFVIDELRPELASKWETSPDGLVFTFTMQSGVKWQNVAPLNGRAFTAEDAAFALSRLGSEGVHTQYFANVDSIVATDSGTLTITLKRPQPDFIYPLATAYTPIHPRELVDDGTIAQRAVGTGPVLLERWEAAVGGDFVRNPDYWRGPIYIDRFEDRYVPDASAALAMYRSGQVDYGWRVTNERDLESVLSSNPDMQYKTTPVFNSTFALSMNLDLPMWRDERIRRALSLAVDRDAIKNVVYGSLGKIAATPDWQFFWDEEPTEESGRFGQWWRHAPDEARALLDAAGAGDFAFDLLYYLGYGGANVVELLVDQLRTAGIEMRPRSVEYTEFNSQWTARKGESHAYDGWVASGSTAEHNVYGLHHSKSGANRYRINDPQVDAWAEQHQVELDPDVRRDLAQRVWERVYDQVYRIDKPAGHSVELMQPWVRGLNSYISRAGSGAHYLDTGNFLRYGWVDA